MGLDPDDTVDLLRKEFEGQLGRPISEAESSVLEDHALQNYKEVMKPTLLKRPNKT